MNISYKATQKDPTGVNYDTHKTHVVEKCYNVIVIIAYNILQENNLQKWVVSIE